MKSVRYWRSYLKNVKGIFWDNLQFFMNTKKLMDSQPNDNNGSHSQHSHPTARLVVGTGKQASIFICPINKHKDIA